jgi:hypothetical protein
VIVIFFFFLMLRSVIMWRVFWHDRLQNRNYSLGQS